MAGASDFEDADEITGINVTPLVDIVLVLLIIFMMTASYIVTPAIKVNLPKAASAEATVQSTLALVLTKEGDLFVNNDKVDYDQLRAFVKKERALHPEVEAIIAADASITHGKVVGLIDLIKSEGIVKFALNTEADFSSATEDSSGESSESEAPEPEAP